MATRKILDIDLSQIERFSELFGKYQEQLERTRPAWAAVGRDANVSAASFDRLTAALLAQNELSRRLGAEQRASTNNLRQQAGLWDRISHSTAGVSKHVVEATKSLLRWTGIISAMGGLIGAGGLWGIDRLAITAGTGRKDALGLGLSYGENKAFGTEFSPLVDPSHYLQGVFTALHDVTQRWSLIAAGMTPNQMQGDTAQVGVQLLGRLKQIADQTPEALLGQVLQARGLDRFIGLQDFERLKHTPATEIQQWQQQYQQARPLVELTQQQQYAWQRLQVQLNLAGQAIETALIRNLTPLAPQLDHLSHAFVDLINSALGSGTFKKWIDEGASALEEFAGYIKTPEFKQNVEDFIAGIGHLATAVGNGLRALGVLPADNSPEAKKAQDDEEAKRVQRQKDWDAAHPDSWVGGAEKRQDILKKAKPIAPWGSNPFNLPGVDPNWMSPTAYRPTMGGMPGGPSDRLLAAVAWTESRGRANAVSPAGAMGEFQFMPGTWAQYGHGSPFDPIESRKAAARYLGTLLRRYHGNVEEATAAYNWGEGNVDKDIARNGSNWLAHAPRETQNYVSQIARLLRAQIKQQQAAPRPTVRVENNTGGNAVVSLAQLGAA